MSKIACLTTLNSFILLWLILSSTGCAAPQKPYSEAPVDFDYQMQGQTGSLSRLRHKPLLLVLVRTSEVTNEMHLDQIQRMYARAIRHLNVLVLSIAPNEAPMLDMFVEFHSYSFRIGMAPWNVASGQSDLGILPAIPTTFIIDENGRIVDFLAGAINADKILETLRRHRFIP
jgi:peroxiredoxin